MTPPPFVSDWLSQPRRLIWILVVLLIAWSGWQGWQSIVDQPLDEAQVTAHQAKVNQTALQQFQKGLASYQRPASVGLYTSPPFKTGP